MFYFHEQHRTQLLSERMIAIGRQDTRHGPAPAVYLYYFCQCYQLLLFLFHFLIYFVSMIIYIGLSFFE